ncbi:MAG TPA: hypothetical protein EYM78_13860 [Gemmatimonadetes bacterium]|nr:hypothetical protein [Gemmatimonadota bacterium]HIC55128.1 hypothetical protein [Gemmatimonadota bacterium]HIN51767.1 hypothetical protein [Gemmatimonadota bacterium]
MKIRSSVVSILILAFSVAWSPPSAQGAQDVQDNESRMNAETFEGLELRNIGPAFKSGRIADLIIHPEEAQSEAAALGVDLVRAGAPWVGGNPLPRGPGG